MKRTLIRLLLAPLLATNLFLVSCVALYKPSVVQSPMLKEKGDATISASVGVLGTGLYNMQGAYAPKEHIGVALGLMGHTENIDDESGLSETTNIWSGEVSGGYFSTFGAEKQGLFQCYGGAGLGRGDNVRYEIDQSEPRISTDYATVFIQPGVAYVSKHYDAAFDVRNNVVFLYNTNAYLMDHFEFWNTQSSFVSDTTMNFMLVEPTLTLRFGPEHFKGFIQLGFTLPAWNSDVYFDVFGSSLLLGQFFKFSIGMTILLPTK